MTTELNLIPDTYRAQLRRLRLFELLKGILMATLLYLIFVAVLLLIARGILQREFVRIVGETNLVTRENRGIESSIRTLNAQISIADRLEANSHPWSEYLIHLSSVVPNDIRLRSLDLSLTDVSSIEGTSSTREALTELKKRLTSDPAFSQVSLPASTLLKKENIDFRIEFMTVLKSK